MQNTCMSHNHTSYSKRQNADSAIILYRANTLIRKLQNTVCNNLVSQIEKQKLKVNKQRTKMLHLVHVRRIDINDIWRTKYHVLGTRTQNVAAK
jgi:2C-methyl-D-erythritol 2,4-cyclodiphosphate synthase